MAGAAVVPSLLSKPRHIKARFYSQPHGLLVTALAEADLGPTWLKRGPGPLNMYVMVVFWCSHLSLRFVTHSRTLNLQAFNCISYSHPFITFARTHALLSISHSTHSPLALIHAIYSHPYHLSYHLRASLTSSSPTPRLADPLISVSSHPPTITINTVKCVS